MKYVNPVTNQIRKSKIARERKQRLEDLTQPQFRLRIGDYRIFYDVEEGNVNIFAIVPKAMIFLSAMGGCSSPRQRRLTLAGDFNPRKGAGATASRQRRLNGPRIPNVFKRR